jgi:hypothetical protein
MTMQNHENQQTPNQPVNDAAMQEQNINASRRRFTRLGLGASGVVMTLASRSVLAQNVCKSPSGFMSNNASAHIAQPICTGTDPDGWKTMPDAAWAPVDKKTTTFVSVFGPTAAAWSKVSMNRFLDVPLASGNASAQGQASSQNGNKSAKADTSGLSFESDSEAKLYDVMVSAGTPLVVRYLIAAYMNAVTQRNAFPTVDHVRNIYTEWSLSGRYEVSAGIFWTEKDIIDYLDATMHEAPLSNNG